MFNDLDLETFVIYKLFVIEYLFHEIDKLTMDSCRTYYMEQ